MLGRLVAIALALLSAACSSDALLFLPYPNTEGFASMVVAVDGRSKRQLAAIDVALGQFPVQLEESLEPDEAWEAHALLFREGLEALELEAGALMEASEAEPYPILLEPDQLLTRSSASSETDAWTPSTTTPTRFHPLRLVNDDPFGFCPSVELSQIDLPNAGPTVRFVIPLGVDDLLIAVDREVRYGTVRAEQKLFRVRLESGAPVVRELSIPISPRLLAADMDDEGVIWFADSQAALHQLSLDGDQVTMRDAAAGPGIMNIEPNWLHVGPEFVVMMAMQGPVLGAVRTSSATLNWVAEPLFDFGVGTGRNLMTGAFLVRGQNELWVAKGSVRTLLRVEFEQGAFAVPELIPGLENEPAIGLSALAEHEGLGILAGMTDGEIRRFDPEREAWDSLGATRFTQVLHAIEPTAEGFFMAGGTGLFNFYFHPEGYCLLDVAGYDGLRAPTTVRFLEPFGGGYLLAGTTLSDSTQVLAWVRPRR